MNWGIIGLGHMAKNFAISVGKGEVEAKHGSEESSPTNSTGNY